MVSTKVQRKEILKATHISKKTKFIDDLIVAKATQITSIRDQ